MADESVSRLLDYSHGVPISALRHSAKTTLSNFLDCEGFVIGDYSNDWCGLAEIIGFTNREMRGFEQRDSPTMALLDTWASKKELKPTIDNLLRFLLEIHRPDVITESERIIRRDIEDYMRHARPAPRPQPVEHGEEERFDAFVVYADTSRDICFTKDMIHILEGEEYGIKLFVPGRDDLAGTEKYVLSADMIANRCRRVILVLSKGFEKSEYCDFSLKLAQSLSPGAKSKRIIPILLDQVQIPLILNFVRAVDFTNPHQREWVWPRVAATIKSPLIPNVQDWLCTIDDLKNMRYNTKAVSHMFYGLGVAVTEFPDDDENDKS